jgi:hypothetical protein
MKYGTAQGILKPLDEVTLPDPRFEGKILRSEDSEQPITLADFHERLNICPLSSNVPEKVRIQFETAKNLMLYAWFVFEFQTIAELQAYAALELGLRARLGNPTRTITSKKGQKIVPLMLAELLSKAVSEKLIVPENLPSWEWAKVRREWFSKEYGTPIQPFSASEWMQDIQKHLPDSRNHLAHGNQHLWLNNSFSQIELCGDLIAALFSGSEKTVSKPARQ